MVSYLNGWLERLFGMDEYIGSNVSITPLLLCTSDALRNPVLRNSSASPRPSYVIIIIPEARHNKQHRRTHVRTGTYNKGCIYINGKSSDVFMNHNLYSVMRNIVCIYISRLWSNGV